MLISEVSLNYRHDEEKKSFQEPENDFHLDTDARNVWAEH